MAISALFCYVAKFTSSDCASILPFFFYIPINCWMKKALGDEKVWKNTVSCHRLDKGLQISCKGYRVVGNMAPIKIPV